MLQNGMITFTIKTMEQKIYGFYYSPSNNSSLTYNSPSSTNNNSSSKNNNVLTNNVLTKCFLLHPFPSWPSIHYLSSLLSSALFSEITYEELLYDHDIKRFKLALVHLQKNISLKCSINYYIDYVVKFIGQSNSEKFDQCRGVCQRPTDNDIASYYPFSSTKIYHRNVNLLTTEEIALLESWHHCYHSFVQPLIVKSNCPKNIADTKIQKFLLSMIDDGKRDNNDSKKDNNICHIILPRSYRLVNDEYCDKKSSSYQEQLMIEWGVNIYHSSCRELALWLLGQTSYHVFDNIRLPYKTTHLNSICSNSMYSPQANKYLMPIMLNALNNDDPNSRQPTYLSDPYGLLFRNISNYYYFSQSYVVNDKGKENTDERSNETRSNETRMVPQKSPSSIKWDDFSPQLGDNVWVELSFLHRTHEMNILFLKTIEYLQHSKGGFYHSPLNSENTLWTLKLEDNVLMYAYLSLIIKYCSNDEKYVTMRNGIDYVFDLLIDHDELLFHDKVQWINGEWINNQSINNKLKIEEKNRCLVNTRAHLWLILALQPAIIDTLFACSFATLKMWNKLKEYCSNISNSSNISTNISNSSNISTNTSVFTTFYNDNNNNIIHCDVQFSALMAGEILLKYYGESANIAPFTINKDLQAIKQAIYSDDFYHQNGDESFFIHGKNLSTKVASICSTSWHVFYNKSFNPLFS